MRLFRKCKNPHESQRFSSRSTSRTSFQRISAVKVLTFGLDKTLLNCLNHEECTYRVTTPAERDHFNLEDVSDYALLASSGCYRLPSGPFSDNSIAMAVLRVAMRTLGFKPKL
jgi:chitin synthase